MFTTLSKRLTILFLALLSAGFVCAEEWMKSGLHCGQIVVLTATPEPDYRFSGWSDGNTDNPRRVEVTKAMELQALFVSACEAQYILPVDFLFSQMYVLNRNRLKEMGYAPQAVEVRWYRVVGEIDNVTSSGGDDVLVTTGYYLSRDGLPGGQYYAQCNFPNPESERCDIVLRSQVYYVSLTGLTDAEGASLRLIPTVSDKGQLLTLTGMPVTEPATVSVFDMSGRLLWRAVSDATETMSFAAQAAAGCYLVHVKTSRLDQTLLYIVR
jgi:hypothetical protein